jgi:hypothetical protein
MIRLASDCLLFEMTTGETVPLCADMISVELSGSSTSIFDPEFVKQAANAVFHYFKQDLGRTTITVAEFADALEGVLRGFGFAAQQDQPAPPPPPNQPRDSESDLRLLACESGKGCELFFFPRLREELRSQLRDSPSTLRFRGLRGCVKQLTGAQRWCPRCRKLQNQILEFLRHCVSAEGGEVKRGLLVR